MRVTDQAARRTRHAYQTVRSSVGSVDALPGLPVLLRTQGLMMALASLTGRDAGIGEGMVRYLGNEEGVGWAQTPLRPGSGRSVRGFVDAWTGLDVDAASAVQHEALRYAEQLKLVATLTGGPR